MGQRWRKGVYDFIKESDNKIRQRLQEGVKGGWPSLIIYDSTAASWHISTTTTEYIWVTTQSKSDIFLRGGQNRRSQWSANNHRVQFPIQLPSADLRNQPASLFPLHLTFPQNPSGLNPEAHKAKKCYEMLNVVLYCFNFWHQLLTGERNSQAVGVWIESWWWTEVAENAAAKSQAERAEPCLEVLSKESSEREIKTATGWRRIEDNILR